MSPCIELHIEQGPVLQEMRQPAAAVAGRGLHSSNRPISVFRFPRQALTLCPQLCMGIQSGACFPAFDIPKSASSLLSLSSFLSLKH